MTGDGDWRDLVHVVVHFPRFTDVLLKPLSIVVPSVMRAMKF